MDTPVINKSVTIKRIVCILISIIFYLPVKSQTNPSVSNCIQSLNRFNNSNLIEKVYVHTDKSIYSVGEDIWFCVYVTNKNNIPASYNTIVYVELFSSFDNKMIKRLNIWVIDGVGKGDIHLPNELIHGDYLIRAYTLNMLNYGHEFFFKKQIIIQSTLKVVHELPMKEQADTNNIDIQFFPEGGELIEGYPNIVAFKVINKEGYGIAVKGKIVNALGDSIDYFKTIHQGMGKFMLNPQNGSKYSALFSYNGKEYSFKLPEAISNGYQMNVMSSSRNVYINVQCKDENQLVNSFIIGQSAGEIFSIHEMKRKNNYFHIHVPKDSIPHGIAYFTFFDPYGNPRCERLVFIEKDNTRENNFLSISTNKENYDPKEKVNLQINLNDDLDKSIVKNLSFSVVASNYSNQENENINMYNYLLLISELKGKIENPAYYFNDENVDRKEALDLLMLTHGWRRFKWDSLFKDDYNPVKYYPEKGFSFYGRLFNYYKQTKPVQGEVSLTFMEDFLSTAPTKTDENGYFHFSGYDILDTVTVIIQANKLGKKKNRKNKSNDAIYIEYQDPFPLFQGYLWTNIRRNPKSDNHFKDTIMIYDKESTLLEEVKIMGKSPEYERMEQLKKNAIHDSPSQRLFVDETTEGAFAMNVFSYLKGRCPGLVVKGSYPNFKFIIRGISKLNFAKANNNDALILYNNMTIEANQLVDMSMLDIAYIDILTDSRAAMYGLRGSNGVVAIYSNDFVYAQSQKTTLKRIDKMGIINFRHPGYYKAREFYSPKYSTSSIKDSKDDNRTTLYWSPQLSFSELGTHKSEFYTSSIQSDYIIQIEGILKNGQIIVAHKTFSVYKP